MKNLRNTLIIACALICTISCKTNNDKNKAATDNITIYQMVEKTKNETQRSGIWFVKGFHSTEYTPTIETDKVAPVAEYNQREKDLCRISAFFNASRLLLDFWRYENYPVISKDDLSIFATFKSSNQEELQVYGYQEEIRARFSIENTLKILKYFLNAEGPVTFKVEGVDYYDKKTPTTVAWEFPTEGMKEVSKCWVNALNERDKQIPGINK